MKTNKAVRMGDNLVGVEINTIQDVVKAQAAGLELVDKDGWGYDYTTDDEETGDEVDPTEKEIFDRISKDIADGKEVYACMTLANDWCVQENAKTTMRTNFYVGQEVYLMRNNKIVTDEIIYIDLVKSKNGEECKLVLGGDQGHYTKAKFVFPSKEKLIESLMAE